MTVMNTDIMWSDPEIRAFRKGTVLDHREEADIARIIEVVDPSPDNVALDLGTGLGFVARALAPRVKKVDALDPDGEMLEEARSLTAAEGIGNIDFIQGDMSALRCEKECYDIVTARLAMRHLNDGGGFVRETHRVLKPSGTFVLVDSLAPPHSELAAFLKNLFHYHDRSHVKSYTLAELETLLERDDFEIDLIEIYPKEHNFETWAKKHGADHDNVRMIAKMLQSTSERARRHFRVVEEAGKLVSFVTWMILVRARPARLRQT